MNTHELNTLRQRAAELVDECVTLLEQVDRADLAENLTAAGRSPHPGDRPVVAVVGESSRGKSALVNALIGRPELSPVDPQVTTCAPIHFSYGEEDRATVLTVPSYSDASSPLVAKDIGLDEIDEYAHESKNPENRKRVHRVEVTVRSSTLAQLDLTIVDTPGVSGLNTGHADVTLAQLRESGGVIMVTAADAQLSATELEFLRKAARQVGDVIVAVTKKDLHEFEYEQIVDADRELIKHELPELGQPVVIPIGTPPAEEMDWPFAADSGDSGVDQLITVLEERVHGRLECRKLTLLVTLCLDALNSAQQQIDANRVTAADDNELRRNLAGATAHLRRLEIARSSWHPELSRRLRHIEGDFVGHAGEYADGLFTGFLEQQKSKYLARGRMAMGEKRFVTLTNELQAAVATRYADLQTDIVTAIHRILADNVGREIAAHSFRLGEVTPPEVPYRGKPYEPKTLNQHAVEWFQTVSPVIGIHSLIAGVGSALAIGALASTGGYLLIVPVSALALYIRSARNHHQSYQAWVENYIAQADRSARRDCGFRIEQAAAADVEEKINSRLEDEIEATGKQVAAFTKAAQHPERHRGAVDQTIRQAALTLSKCRHNAREILDTLQIYRPFDMKQPGRDT